MEARNRIGNAEERTRARGDNSVWEVMDVLGQGVAILGADGRFEYVNLAFAQMAGYSREVLLTFSPFDVTHPDDQEKLQWARQQQWSGAASTYETRLVQPDGTPVNVRITQSPRWEAAQIIGAYAVITDLTERERIRGESEELYRRTLDNMLEGCQIIGFDWRYLYVNNAVAIQAKQTKEALLGRTMMEMYPGIEQTELFTVLQRCMKERVAEQMENEFTFPDGSQGWFELRLEPVPEGIFILSFDITENKKAEAALRQSKTELEHIIDSVPEGVLLLTPDGSVRLTNPVADKFLRILAPEWESGRLTHLGNRPLRELLTSPPKGLWHEINLDDYSFETIARPVEHSPENTGWVLVMRDITREKEVQRQVQQQERLAAVGQLASGIAHDFNNIMAVIILYAQLLSRKIETTDTQEKLNTIERQAHQATDLIQQILDFSRQSIMKQQPVDLLPFMKELAKLLDRTLPDHIQIELDYAEGEYIIQADPSRIQQVMMNLAVNARDAMPDGGQLQLSLAHLQVEKVKSVPVSGMLPGNWIQIQVADSGSGMPPQVLSKIFEPFFTTKEVGKGTGLGLAQVYGIVKQHGGHIDVATKEGQGTIFMLYFPSLDTGETTALEFDDTVWQPGGGQMVLVVEDDPVTRRALVDSLVFMNYAAVEATNGREALTILTDKSDEIALVLSDTIMPEMGGVALLHAMRQRKLEIPIVLLTGHSLSREIDNLQALGLAGWLLKPPNLVELSHLLAQVLSD